MSVLAKKLVPSGVLAAMVLLGAAVPSPASAGGIVCVRLGGVTVCIFE